jgi:hypothetical protein
LILGDLVRDADDFDFDFVVSSSSSSSSPFSFTFSANDDYDNYYHQQALPESQLEEIFERFQKDNGHLVEEYGWGPKNDHNNDQTTTTATTTTTTTSSTDSPTDDLTLLSYPNDPHLGDGISGTRLAFQVPHPGFTIVNTITAQQQSQFNQLDPLTQSQLHSANAENDTELMKLHTLLSATKVRALGLDQNVVTTSILLAKLLGIEVIIGDGEADTTLASLFEKKYIHSVITQDNDLVVRGADVIRNAFKRDKEMVYCRQTMLQTTLGLTTTHLLILALILGNDYAPGITNVGPVQALELVSKYPTLHEFQAFINTIKHNPPHRWVLPPPPFPSPTAITSFTYPQDGILYAHPPSSDMAINAEHVCDMLYKQSGQDYNITRSVLARMLATHDHNRGHIKGYVDAIKKDPRLGIFEPFMNSQEHGQNNPKDEKKSTKRHQQQERRRI